MIDEDLEQAELDAEPCRPARPGPKPTYKPGHRELPATSEQTSTDGSWWMRPDADFAAEARRMRDNPKPMRTPGEHAIIGMAAIW